MSFITKPVQKLVGDITGTNQQAKAAKSAADIQNQSANTAANNTMAMYNQTRADLQPYNNTGLAGNTQLQQGINDGSLTRSFNLGDFQADPSYQFVKQQGLDNLQSQAAARGGLLSGATLKALDNYNNNLASQQYQQAYTNFNNDQQNRYNRLYQTAVLGQNSAAQQGAQGATATENANNFRTQGANSLAAGTIAAGNGAANRFGTLLNIGNTAAKFAGAGM